MRQFFFLLIFGTTFLLTLSPVLATFGGSSPHKTVILSDQGFDPESVTILSGTTIDFVIQGKSLHWPASNFHPTHGEYPEKGGCIGSKLDACHGLKPGETYSFTFDHPGVWGMHDHLFPGFTMVIRVEGNSSQKQSLLQYIFSVVSERINMLTGKTQPRVHTPETPSLSPSQKASALFQTCKISPAGSSKRYTCYARNMEEVAYRYGRDYAHSVLSSLGDKDASAKSCHFISHGIGWGIYEANPDNWRADLSDSSSACAYGEQMGILEYYIKSLPDGQLKKEDVPAICGPHPHGTCNHMVGHMLLILSKNNIPKAAQMCSTLSPLQQYHCFTGLNMETIMSPNLVEHGLLPAVYANWVPRIFENEKRCRSYGGIQASTCWKVLGIGAFEYFKHDPKNVFDFCETAQTASAAFECKMYSMSGFVSLYDYHLDKLHQLCEMDTSTDLKFKTECNKLIVALKINYLPINQAGDTVPFCSQLDESEQAGCFAVIGLSLRQAKLDQSTRQAFCKAAPSSYKDLCIGNNVPTALL
jgi:plastocyanin